MNTIVGKINAIGRNLEEIGKGTTTDVVYRICKFLYLFERKLPENMQN